MTADQSCRTAIDEIYASFVDSLPTKLTIGAERLPRRLGLSTRGDVGWGDVFDDAPVLGLPIMLLRGSSRQVSEVVSDCALRAHVFAMLAALVHTRVGSGEVEADAELDAILAALERDRNRAIAELRLLGADRSSSFALPERDLRRALAREQEVVAGDAEAKLADYVAVSTAKQSMAFPAMMAASYAAGYDVDELGHIHEVVLGAMLGLQIRNDVEDWLDDIGDDRSWVVVLSGGRAQIDVLVSMLEVGRDAFGRAADSARALGAMSLTRWARVEASSIRELLRICEGQLSPALTG